MPKMKSSRAARKRFKTTATGKVKRKHAATSHKFTCKAQDRKRRLRKSTLVSNAESKRIKRMLQD